jgi:hypothetical protein
VKKAKPADDVVFVLGPTGEAVDSPSYRVLRRRRADDEVRLEAGELRPLEHGKPIDGEVVSLAQRDESPRLFDVKTEYEAPKRDSAGPARVATTDYRKGWDKIWGRRAASAQPN